MYTNKCFFEKQLLQKDLGTWENILVSLKCARVLGENDQFASLVKQGDSSSILLKDRPACIILQRVEE